MVLYGVGETSASTYICLAEFSRREPSYSVTRLCLKMSHDQLYSCIDEFKDGWEVDQVLPAPDRRFADACNLLFKTAVSMFFLELSFRPQERLEVPLQGHRSTGF